MTKRKLAELVDRCGQLKERAEKARLEYELARDRLIDLGVTDAEGNTFKAVVSHYDETCLNRDAVLARLQPSRQLLTAHTSYIPRCRVTVTRKARRAG